MMKEELKKRIADFWDGHLDREERSDLLSDLENDEDDLRVQLEDDFDKNENVGSDFQADDAQSVLEELHRKMGVVKDFPVKRRLYRYWMIAVALVAVFGLSVSIMRWRENPSGAHNLISNHLTETDTVRLINRNVDIKKTLLPDGSTVILSAGSELIFSKNAIKKDRIFHLKGEAQFQVARDPSRPFVVWANGFTTTAIGTTFSINAQGSGKVDVSLLSGKIMVKSTAYSSMQIPDQYLSPGETLSIDLKMQSIALHASPAEITLRTNNLKTSTIQKDLPLQFYETPLTEVFAEVARRKHVEIVTDGIYLEGLSFTGEFNLREPTLSIVHIVCQLNNLYYLEDGNQIIIQQKEHIQENSPIEQKSETTN